MNTTTTDHLFIGDVPKLKFNPFSGLNADEIFNSIVPEFDFEELKKIIKNQHPITIELIGKKGRGKTTHLKAFHQYLGNQYIFDDLDEFTKNTSHKTSEIHFIDSIHNLSFFKRRSLWKDKTTSYIITNHHSKKLEYVCCNRKFKSFSIGQNKSDQLLKIVNNRITLALRDECNFNINISYITTLLNKYKNDKRSILNMLFYEFQNKNYYV